MIKVRINDGDGIHRTVETFQPVVHVGRAPDSGVFLSVPGVEWRHGQLLDREGRVFYRDLQSRSGSRVRAPGREELGLMHTLHAVEVFPGDEILIGDAVVQILSAETHPYTDDSTDAMAIVESRSGPHLQDLVRRLEKDHKVLEQIYRFEQQLSDMFDLNRLFAAISDAIFEVYEKGTHLFVALVDGEKMDLVLAGRRPGVVVPDGPASLSRFLVEQVVKKGEALLFNLTKAGALQLQQRQSRQIDPTESVRLNRIQSGICAPLWSGTSIIGVLEVDNRVEAAPFTTEERDLLVMFANRAALAIEKHRRYTRDLQAARDATIGQVVSKVVHDLNNHFGILHPLGELLDQDLGELQARITDGDSPNPAEQALASVRDNWQRIKQHQQFMWNLLDDLRHFGRDRRPEYARVPLADIARTCVQTAEFRAADRGRKVVFHVADDGDRFGLLADPSGVRRAVQNLLNNSVDAIPKGTVGVVCLSVDAAEVGPHRYVRLSVRDTGCGIPEDLIGRIFEYGFSTKAGVSGSGFGLPVIRKIVAEHRGFISIASRLNAGTAFHLHFPAVTSPEEVSRYPEREEDLVLVGPWPDSEVPTS